MTGSTRVGVLAALGVAFAVGAILAAQRAGGSADPLDAIPKDSFLVATVRADELRQSPVWEALLGADATRAVGAGELAGACGFDPLARVERAAFAVPEAGDRGDFGLSAKVRVTRDELARCTATLGERRGGRTQTREHGSFTVLEDDGGKRGAIAYGAGGLLLVGRGAWLEAMMNAADRRAPRIDAQAEHAALRRALTGHEGFGAPTLVTTVLLPKALRARLQGEMGAEVGSADGAQAAMGGVLEVESAGLAVRAGGPGKDVDAIAELRCETDAACKEVEKLVLGKRLAWSRDLTVRMLGFGELVDSLEVRAAGPRLVATARVRSETLAAAIERLQKVQRARPPEMPPTPPPKAPRPPDERVPAPR